MYLHRKKKISFYMCIYTTVNCPYIYIYGQLTYIHTHIHMRTYMQLQCVLYFMVYSPGFQGTSVKKWRSCVSPRTDRWAVHGTVILLRIASTVQSLLALIVNDSAPVFTFYSTLICSTTVLSEILIVIPAYWGSSFMLYCMVPNVVKIRKVEPCKYGEGSWSLTKLHNNKVFNSFRRLPETKRITPVSKLILF